MKSSALDRIFQAGLNGNSFKARNNQNEVVFRHFQLLANPKIKISQKKAIRELRQKMTHRYFSANTKQVITRANDLRWR